ncbi:MAG: cyclic nucleotide-binding domain-containing protein [Chthoniobacterales bacterium]
MASLIETEHDLIAVIIFIATYFVTLAIGRLLKRRAGVQIGVFFQLFCLTLAFYAASGFYGLHADWRNHVGALLVLLSSGVLLALIDRYIWTGYFERKRQTPIPHIVRQVAALVIFLVALLLILSVGYHAQAQLTGLLAGSGVAVIVIGVAAQNVLGSIIAGASLQISRPYKVGDWLQVNDRFGEVMEINWRSTRLRTNDHIYLDIPNNEIVRQTIINLHYPTQVHAMRLRVGVDYNTPPNKVKDALFRAAINAEGVLSDPKPRVFVVDFAESAVVYEVKYSMGNHAHYNEVSDALRTNIWYEFKRQQLTIPFPIRTVQLQRKHTEGAADARDEARAIMRNEPLFRCLEDDQLNRLVASARLDRFGRGERVIEEGGDGNSMFVLIRGTAHVSVTKNESAIRVGVLRTGDCFGEMSMLTGERRSATVRADADCEVLEIEKDAMSQIFHDAPECLNQLSEVLAQRRLETEGIVRDASDPRDLAKEGEYRASFLSRLKAVFEL